MKKSIITAIIMSAVLLGVGFLNSCTSGAAPPLLFGIEYQIKDTPVIVSVSPGDKGGYDWDFRVAEGEITDWLVKQADGSYLVTTKKGIQIRIEKTANGKPQITVISTGENAEIRLVPIEPEPLK